MEREYNGQTDINYAFAIFVSVTQPMFLSTRYLWDWL